MADAESKGSKRKRRAKVAGDEDRGSGRLAGLADRLGSLGESASHPLRVTARIAAGLALTAGAVGAVLAVEPLRGRVAELRADPLEVRFVWPTGADTASGTWLPETVQRGLTDLVAATVTLDPFDHQALGLAHDRLVATGWFRELRALRRAPGNIVHVEGVWRVPAAVVRSSADGELLVGHDAAPMQLPSGATPSPGLFRILNPAGGAPRFAESGSIAYGEPWPYDDVDHAIALLQAIEDRPAASAVVAIDLGEYPDTGDLILLTDLNCRIVWGAPIGERRPGEASVEHKLAALDGVLNPRDRLDAGHARIPIADGRARVDNRPPRSTAP